MKNGIKFIAAMSLAFAGMVGTTATVNHVVATTVTQCGCGNASCQGGCRARKNRRPGNTDCGCTQCPQCEGEMCKLELDKSKIKKTCFKVEQKAICIPPVRLPWKKTCPPGVSKTKTVNKLITHSYECPNCSYQWTLQEPEIAKEPTAAAQFEPIPVYENSYPNQIAPNQAPPWSARGPQMVPGQPLPIGR